MEDKEEYERTDVTKKSMIKFAISIAIMIIAIIVGIIIM